MSLFLSTEDIEDMTGRHRRNAQVRVLRFMGIEHKVRPDGSVAVLRSHVDSVLGGVSGSKAVKELEPNWSAV